MITESALFSTSQLFVTYTDDRTAWTTVLSIFFETVLESVEEKYLIFITLSTGQFTHSIGPLDSISLSYGILQIPLNLWFFRFLSIAKTFRFWLVSFARPSVTQFSHSSFLEIDLRSVFHPSTHISFKSLCTSHNYVRWNFHFTYRPNLFDFLPLKSPQKANPIFFHCILCFLDLLIKLSIWS